MRSIAFLSLLAIATVVPAQAQQDLSRTISYQGVLIDRWTGAKAVTGSYTLTVRLYSDSLGERQIWKDEYTTTILDGVFSLLLGAGRVPLPPSTDLDKPLWLGLQPQNEDELRPLAPLTAAAFALNVPDSSITTSKLATHAVTEDKLAVQYVRGISVDGQSVTASGSNHFVNFRGTRGVEFSFDPPSRMVSVGIHNTLWTAPELKSDTHDLPIDPNARIIRLANMQTCPLRLTGIDHETSLDGRIITLTNDGVSAIILLHHSPASHTDNQLSLPGNSLVILAPNGTVDLMYDATHAAWTLIASN